MDYPSNPHNSSAPRASPREAPARGGARPSASDRRPGPSWALLVAVVVVVVLALTACLGALAVGRYEAYLSGLWVGDPTFLEQAHLRDFQLFLGPREGGRRQGYLLMTDLGGNFLANQAIEVRAGSGAQRWWAALRSVFRTRGDAYTVPRVEIEYDAGAPPMPEQLQMALSMADGTLALYGDRVYAFLTKDHVASAAAVAAYAAP